MAVDILVRSVRRRSDARPCDIAVDDGRIVAIGEALDLEATTVLDGGGSLVLPGLANAHQHLDKCLIGATLRPPRWAGFRGCREVNRRHRATYTHDDIAERGSRVVERALEHGTTTMRAFADIVPTPGALGVEALVTLRERYAGAMRLQVACFPQDLLCPHEDPLALMESAMDAGADVVGGYPSGEWTDERMRRHTEIVLDVARRHDADVHMLLDDSDDPSHRSLEYLALRTMEIGWEGRVTVGHAGALSAYDDVHAADVIERVADAGISVCVNPQISLVLQGRLDRGPVRRGTTRVGELLAAGVNVLAAQDDVDDPYYVLGRADQLEVAQYAAHVCHLAWPEEMETVLDMVGPNAARAMRVEGLDLEVGGLGDLVVVGAPDVVETLREIPPRRAVVSHGRVVCEARVTRVRHGGEVHP